MKCRICGNEKENKAHKAKEMMYGYRDSFYYFQCAECECLQIESFPEDISNYYPNNYYSYQVAPPRHKIKFILKVFRDRYALWKTGILGKFLYAVSPNLNLRTLNFLSVKKNTSILDVGCGSGDLLHSLKDIGVHTLLGVDPFNEKDIQYENGLKIQKTEVHSVQGKWDVIMFHHSFEHISDPAETLNTVFNLIESDGCCVIRIPVVPCYAWEHYGVNWVQLDAPRHFYLHSVKSMNILAAQAGLEVYKVVYDATSFQFIGSELYLKDMPLEESYSEKSLFSKKERRIFDKRTKELNKSKQGDQAIFYLRKLRY